MTSESCQKQNIAVNFFLVLILKNNEEVPRETDWFFHVHYKSSELLCLFRHHTNPVGMEWRWKMDQPERILQEALGNHQSMIKQFKGIFPLSSPLVMLLEGNQQ